MQLTSLADWNCSIARTLDVVGEWWTLLILRDAFRGTHRFDDFKDSLGLARSVLTARLAKLTEHGVLERRAYSQHPPRYEYHLTEKGRALFPVIATLIHWGDQWAPTPAGPPGGWPASSSCSCTGELKARRARTRPSCRWRRS